MRRQLFITWFILAATAPVSIAQDFAALREKLVTEEIEAAGVKDARVLQAMRTTPRHEFVPAKWLPQAYLDAALPIGDQQTISPPYVVAYMTAQLNPQPTDRVLEIGTGSGYQAAVLSPLVKEVYTIEIVPRLSRRAEQILRRLGYDNVHVRVGDGYEGWPEVAPFNKIIVTCSPEAIPMPLIEQLAEGGQMIIPIGERYQQNLLRVSKQEAKLTQEPLQATLFVPMTGKAEDARLVLPDPANPGIANGDFKRVLGKDRTPEGWHYLRNVEVRTEDTANLATLDSASDNFLSFQSTQSGEPSRALQGLALDGRKVRSVRLSARIRGKDLRAGPTHDQIPAIVLTCYDHRRAAIENQILGPWQGSFDWKTVEARLQIPSATREAILRLGLLGGTGKLDIDDVRLEAGKK
ncbi:protein-L-isoaspartate(D-aspartate) O-methyltransferase [Bythopirellula polymerisocia]|uniref:Protein-L-isoaspartate O-methyltransferase n=1 Tax=Bythopirellula polymerisocia TaxID=2528003 RepID=A0A5C6CP02_9BACT|nr:protein-L-isoaspartate(D-aspartate) O-methyltransferase [Bythopirellula polymerisocia]TWU24469.1 Protein-L-isoaspartate O-methyltransferase [Bythopirellula polymerisocia]